MKNDDKEFKGCGGNCACAKKQDEKTACAVPVGGIELDKHGKCPCGKSTDDCCHSDLIEGNDALHELCDEHNGKHVCGIEEEPQKTAV